MKHNLLLALAVTSAAVSASAFDGTIAQFNQTGFNKPFVFNNDESVTGAATFNATGTPVSFTFDNLFTGAYAVLNGTRDATMVMQATTSTKATTVAGHPDWLNQILDSGSLTFTSNTPVEGKSMLLKIAFEHAQIETHRKVGNIQAESYARFCYDDCTSITYTSDFIHFPAAGSESWDVAFTAMTPVPHIQANGLLADFAADGAGSVAYSDTFQVIPEPSTYAVLVGAAALGIAALRRRFSAQGA